MNAASALPWPSRPATRSPMLLQSNSKFSQTRKKKNGVFDSPAAEREEWTEGDKPIADYEVDIR